MEQKLQNLYAERPETYTAAHRELLATFIEGLNTGAIRSCEPLNKGWKVNQWVKMGILIAFRMGVLTELPWSSQKLFFDKDTIREKLFTFADQVRIVPGGSSARNGCYIAKGVTIMPPAFINIGAWIGTNTMVDSHALVGSCAQIGESVHLSAGAMIGGVLEPIGSRPVIVEDRAFIGGNTGLYEGIIVGAKAVIASGTIITASTPVYDAVKGAFLESDRDGGISIPEGAVVVPGSRAMKHHPGFQVYCPIIIKYRDMNTDSSVALENDLRHLMD